MRLLIAIAGLVATVGVIDAAPQQAEAPSDTVERAFVANGRIRMDLSAGDYRIVGVPDNHIRLTWSARDGIFRPRVVARIESRGPDATITTDSPSNSRFRVRIEVPTRADLTVRLTAGELTLERVHGNKDIEAHAGELNIDVGNPDDYRRVEASVWAGELHAGPYGAMKEGLFRSFDWSGHGPYRLNAHLKAGEIRLHGANRSERAKN